jgi:hypothetical protein
MEKNMKNTFDKFVQKGMKTQKAHLRKVKERMREVEELQEVETLFGFRVNVK